MLCWPERVTPRTLSSPGSSSLCLCRERGREAGRGPSYKGQRAEDTHRLAVIMTLMGDGLCVCLCRLVCVHAMVCSINIEISCRQTMFILTESQLKRFIRKSFCWRTSKCNNLISKPLDLLMVLLLLSCLICQISTDCSSLWDVHN